MTVCKSHVSLTCYENMKQVSFIVSKQRARYDFQCNGDVNVKRSK